MGQWCHITLVSLKGLEKLDPADTLNAPTYAQGQFPKEEPHWGYQWLDWFQETLLRV
jgi:hypothetical protein